MDATATEHQKVEHVQSRKGKFQEGEENRQEESEKPQKPNQNQCVRGIKEELAGKSSNRRVTRRAD